MLCHDGDYVVVLTVSQKHNLRNRTKRPGHQSSLLSINLTLLGQVLQSLMARNTRYWWALYRNIESGYGYWYCIKTSNQNMYFLEFRRANQSTETALKLHWIDPKTAPATTSISRLQRLIACYIDIYIIYAIIYIHLLLYTWEPNCV
jgi:hypothetical protein